MMISYLLILFCVVAWGSNFVFSSILLQQFPPLILSVIRLLFTAIAMLGFAVCTRKLAPMRRKDWLLILPLGLVGTVVNQSTFFIGMQSTDPTTAALILSLAPIVATLLSAVFLKEPVAPRVYVGAVVATSGVFLVVGGFGGVRFGQGELLMFVAMLSFACSMLFVRKLMERYDPYVVTLYSTMVGVAMLIPFALAFEPVIRFSTALWAWALLLVTALLNQGICALIWNSQLKKIGIGRATVFLNFQPFVAMLVSYLLLGMPISLLQAAGSCLIVGGVLIATLHLERRKPSVFLSGKGS